MITEIRERIEVAVLFGRRERIRPVWFLWDGRKIPVRKITYRWTERDGEETSFHFSVTDGGSLYELSYSTKKLLWELVAVETEG